MNRNRRFSDKHQAWKGGLAVLTLLLASLPALGQVYRCTDGETTVFSDRPCSDSAEIYHSPSRISVIEAAPDLSDISKRNQEFVDQRRTSLEERHRERQAERIQPRRPQQYANSDHRFGHFNVLPFFDRRRSGRHAKDDGVQPPMRGPVSEDSFTLSGRQLGSERR
ncbi:MAG: DUF4124 domain-containing protein [Wenzhouxiangellaceae bacterium]|nr:DUF4124 domain-containing protein [Wenzhouxiangellaceae bacterium]